ncbi:hypothetical protein PMAYCL1PPCAC_02799, partial [Pristionchus mayeri]
MLWLSTPLLLLSSLSPTQSEDIQFTPLTKDFLELINNDNIYNRYATPTQYDEYIAKHGEGITTNVSISMYIEGISSFRAQTMDFHLDMYFQQDWIDHRLAHNGSAPMLIRDKTVFKKMWHPDVYFANARSATFQHITEDNFLVWIYPSGRVWYDCRISASIMCDMNLWKFPLDSQQCAMRILSYAYPESQLRLKWTTHPGLVPIEVNSDIRMPDMHLVEVKEGYCNGTYATGVWSCMTATFHVDRQKMHHITQTYVPTGLIVVISWFNFWLDVDSAPARVSLSITTLLTISTQANTVRLALPEVSYMKAIDVWMGSCMAFVFGVMIEFTICHFAKNQELVKSRENGRPGGLGARDLLVDSTLATLFGAARDVDDLTDDDIMVSANSSNDTQHIALNILNSGNGEPRLRGIANEMERNGTKYIIGHDRMRRGRNKPSLGRLRQQ